MVEWLAACLPPFFGIYLHHRCVMRGLEVGISKMFGNFEPVNFLRGGMVQPAIFCTSRVCRFDFFFFILRTCWLFLVILITVIGL